MFIKAHIYIYIYMYIYVCIYIYICMYIYICIIDIVKSLAISVNGKYLATGSWDATVNLIDIQSKKISQKFKNIHFGN